MYYARCGCRAQSELQATSSVWFRDLYRRNFEKGGLAARRSASQVNREEQEQSFFAEGCKEDGGGGRMRTTGERERRLDMVWRDEVGNAWCR